MVREPVSNERYADSAGADGRSKFSHTRNARRGISIIPSLWYSFLQTKRVSQESGSRDIMKPQNVKNRSSKGSKKAGGPTPAFFMPAYLFLLSSHHFKMMSIEGASRLVHNVKNISSTRITSFRWRWFYYSTDVSFTMRCVCTLSFDLRKNYHEDQVSMIQCK